MKTLVVAFALSLLSLISLLTSQAVAATPVGRSMAIEQVEHPAATNPCAVPTPPGVAEWYEDLVYGGAKFQCAPIQSAVSTWPTVRISASKGGVAWWYCKSGNQWYPNWVAGTSSFLKSNNLLGEAAAATASGEPVAALNVLMTKYVGLPLSDPSLTPVWCPHQAEMFAGVPVSEVWTVAKNGTSTTRPAKVANGADFVIGTVRAPVGAECLTSTVIKVGTTTYMNYVGSPNANTYAVCTKQP